MRVYATYSKVLHLLPVEQHDDEGEQLILGQLCLGQNLLQRAKVLLQLGLHVLEHAEAQLVLLAAAQEGLDLVEAGGQTSFPSCHSFSR